MVTDVLTETRHHVWKTLLDIDRALVEKNAQALESALSPDFIGAIPTGEVFKKTLYIDRHCRPGLGIIALSGEDITQAAIRFYGNTAVINRRVHTQFKLPTGNVLDYDVQRTEVLVKENQVWQLVSGQGTRIIPIDQPINQKG
jgi:hypothetical protein